MKALNIYFATAICASLSLASTVSTVAVSTDSAAPRGKNLEADHPNADSSGVDANMGKETFQICAICHNLDSSGVSTTGPNLYGVVGRKVGKLPGFKYSPVLTASSDTWTSEKLNQFLESPQQVFPGNRMPLSGIKDASDRKNVITYIESASK